MDKELHKYSLYALLCIWKAVRKNKLDTIIHQDYFVAAFFKMQMLWYCRDWEKDHVKELKDLCYNSKNIFLGISHIDQNETYF